MSIEIVQPQDTGQFQTGNAYWTSQKFWPCIGIKRTKRSNIHGVAFNNKEALEKAVRFLTEALENWPSEECKNETR